MITSTKNPRIVEVRKLNQRKHRHRQDRFLVDGLQLLSLAVQNRRARPHQIFYCAELFNGQTAPRLLKQLSEAGGEPISVSAKVLATLSERDSPQGLVATFAMSSITQSQADILDALPVEQASLVLILDQLQDPGNLGTMLRTADAVGASAVFLLVPSVDPFDPKTVRGTMGSIFTMPFVTVTEPFALFEQLRQRNYRLVGADGRRGDTVWQSDSLHGSVALLLGNEARGLRTELDSHVERYVSLPLRGQAESLNVAVAGGTLMYEWLRHNI